MRFLLAALALFALAACAPKATISESEGVVTIAFEVEAGVSEAYVSVLNFATPDAHCLTQSEPVGVSCIYDEPGPVLLRGFKVDASAPTVCTVVFLRGILPDTPAICQVKE